MPGRRHPWRHPPLAPRFSNAHAAAPVWPSALRYTDFCARRPKMMNATKRAEDHAEQDQHVHRGAADSMPAVTDAATMITNAPIMYGSSRLSSLR